MSWLYELFMLFNSVVNSELSILFSVWILINSFLSSAVLTGESVINVLIEGVEGIEGG